MKVIAIALMKMLAVWIYVIGMAFGIVWLGKNSPQGLVILFDVSFWLLIIACTVGMGILTRELLKIRKEEKK